MHAKYNSTYDYYTLDILDVQNNPILTGVKIVLGVEMLQPYKKDNLPPGKLTPVAIKNVLRAGKDTMGTDIEFVYDSTAV